MKLLAIIVGLLVAVSTVGVAKAIIEPPELWLAFCGNHTTCISQTTDMLRHTYIKECLHSAGITTDNTFTKAMMNKTLDYLYNRCEVPAAQLNATLAQQGGG